MRAQCESGIWTLEQTRNSPRPAATRQHARRRRLQAALAISLMLVWGGYAGISACISVIDQIHEDAAEALSARVVSLMNEKGKQQRADPSRTRNPAERYLANWLYALKFLKPVEISMQGGRARYSVEELLFNVRDSTRRQDPSRDPPWKILDMQEYDQLPGPILEIVLYMQFEKYGKHLDQDRWPQMQLNEWQSLPVPIRKTAAYRMVWEWTRRRNPHRYGLSQTEAARILASIGLVESLFDLNKIRNLNERTGNEDRGYMQISDLVRRELRRMPEFRAYVTEDYYNPWVSIQAGSYVFFEKMMKHAQGDAIKAIGMYNAGPRGESGRKDRYRGLVVKKYRDTFLKRESYSPTRSLVLQRAEPGFYQDLFKDRLFVHAETGLGDPIAALFDRGPDP